MHLVIVALRVVGRDVSGSRDVVVRVEHHHTVADLCAVVGDHLRVPVPGLISQRTGRVLRSALAVSACGVVTGDVVMIGTESDFVVDVVGGIGSGTSHVLSNGRWLIGRGAAADVSLADPTVSRRHALLDVSAHRIMLTPIGTVLVNGLPILIATTIEVGDVVSVGATQLVVRPAATPCADHRASRDGVIEFRRTPYRQPVVADRGTVTVGPIPERHEPRRMQILSIAGPLLAGLVLFAFMRRVEFLALTLLSPVLLIATTLDERRSGRRSRRREISAFRSMLDGRRRELAVLREAERSERLAAAPDLAELARRAEQTSLDLWPRGRDTVDFLRLRVGSGALATRFDVAIAGGGEQGFREEAVAAINGASTIGDVPITVDLADGVFAIHGDEAAVDGVLTSLVVQAACLHAPADLAIAAAIAPARGCGWIKWVPHVRTGAIPSVASHVASSRFEADRLVRTLLEMARRRASTVDGHERHLLVVIDAELVTDAAAVGPLLELAPAARISVVWIAGSAADVPQQARQVLEVGAKSRLWSTAPGREPLDVSIEPASGTTAERVALALAPIRDAVAGEPVDLATDVTLLDVLGRGATSSATLARWWQRATGFELRFPIGIAPAGPVEIDLVEDGPHVLIAGTTGSGKSELLQSAVTAIAARYSPLRVNFLFVDYKGGAATKVFEHLPHTVGYVSNLDASLARRAIEALRAELGRRMALLEGRAKDLRELVAVAPDQAPPSLVIVIDEFATLAKQLPEFVTAVIDIAQRGRSLGVHLVLSTQRLSGAVDENIVANANVRIALRLLDRADSTAMIGSAAAAEIPAAMRGRGVVRVGSQRPVAFQSAYAARSTARSMRSRPITIADFDDASQLVDAPTCDGLVAASGAGMTQQRAVLAAVAAANDALSLPRPRRPWHEPLASVVALDALDRSHTLPAIGLFDAPEAQEQGPLLVDLERGGGCLIFGSGGSGKTTALRSMALALGSMSREQAPLAILAFDGASRGLSMLRPLPHVVDVATGDDLEAISRHIVMLDRELTRRRQMLSLACAEHLSAYNAGNPPLPRIVVLIDDIGALVDLLGAQGAALTAWETWPERLVRVLVEGRQVGIHGVVTADRRNAVPARLHAAVSNRIVLGHADRLAYADHGVPSDAPALRELTPGRGWWNGSTVIQIAVAALDHSARGQGEAIERVAAKSTSKPTAVLRSTPLPRRVTMRDRSRCAVPFTAPLGVEDVTCGEVTLDLAASHVAIIGRSRSGKSTALRTIAAGLTPGHELYAVGTAASGLAFAPVEHAAFGSPNAIGSLLEELTRQLHSGRPSTSRPTVLLVDDLESLDDIDLAHRWERVAACPELRMVAAVEAAAMTGFTSNPVAAALRRSRRMLVLQPDDPGEFLQMTGVRLDPRPGTHWEPGRGVLVADRVPRIVQVATYDDDGRRTPVRSRGTVADVTVISTQSIRTAAVATPTPR